MQITIYERKIDRSQQIEATDLDVLQASTVAIINAGDQANLVTDLCRAGVGRLFISDVGIVKPTDLARNFTRYEVSSPKVDALKREIHAIDATCKVTTLLKKYEDFSEAELRQVWQAELCMVIPKPHDANTTNYNRDGLDSLLKRIRLNHEAKSACKVA